MVLVMKWIITQVYSNCTFSPMAHQAPSDLRIQTLYWKLLQDSTVMKFKSKGAICIPFFFFFFWF